MAKHTGGTKHHGSAAVEEEPEFMAQEAQAEPPAEEQQPVPADQPPATSTLGWPPAPLGKTPTGINQLFPTYGPKATHFTGPVVSGPPAGSTIGVAGGDVCALVLALDYTMGNFSLPIQFPPDAILLYAALNEPVAFNTAQPSVSLGSQTALVDVLPATVFPGGGKNVQASAAGVIPPPGSVAPVVSGQVWLNVTLNTGNTSGLGLIVLGYARTPRPWN